MMTSICCTALLLDFSFWNEWQSFCIEFIHSIALLSAWAIQKHSRLQHWYCIGVNTLKRYRQLRVKDLPKVPMWQVGFEPATYHWATTPHKACPEAATLNFTEVRVYDELSDFIFLASAYEGEWPVLFLAISSSHTVYLPKLGWLRGTRGAEFLNKSFTQAGIWPQLLDWESHMITTIPSSIRLYTTTLFILNLISTNYFKYLNHMYPALLTS